MIAFGVRVGGTGVPERHIITARETVVVVVEALVVVGGPWGCRRGGAGMPGAVILGDGAALWLLELQLWP